MEGLMHTCLPLYPQTRFDLPMLRHSVALAPKFLELAHFVSTFHVRIVIALSSSVKFDLIIFLPIPSRL